MALPEPHPRSTPSGDVAYGIRRSSRARRARLTISRDGTVTVVLPRRAAVGVADQLVRQHGAWLRRQVGRIHARQRLLAARPPIGEGRVLVVAGTECRVVVEERAGSRRGSVRRSADGAALLVRPGTDGRAVTELLESWLRREARRILADRVAELAPILGVVPTAVTIRAQRSRWGSASAKGRISLNWRLILAPPHVLDYVVTHELAHLRVPGHGRSFWRLVRRHAADVDGARRWLREHHDEVMAALD